jgi:uncharacterized protein YecT (DUF1311 family)
MKLVAMFLVLLLSGAAKTSGQGTQKADRCANAQTQTEMTICWGGQYKAADATLNQVYRQLVAKLDDEEKAQLKLAQTAWLKYRDANCDFVADQFKGGTMRPMVAAMCLADMTSNRTSELRTQIKDRDQ